MPYYNHNGHISIVDFNIERIHVSFQGKPMPPFPPKLGENHLNTDILYPRILFPEYFSSPKTTSVESLDNKKHNKDGKSQCRTPQD